VVAEINLWRDGSRREIEFTYVQNGDLTRWAEKILKSAQFSAAKLDGSPLASRLPVHVVFLPKEVDLPARYEVWLPTDSANYQACLLAHFLAINESLAPVLVRAGAYDYPSEAAGGGGVIAFEVYVNKDGSREEGRLVYTLGDEFTRQALVSAVELQILPARYRSRGFGSWLRVMVGFCPDWTYPTQPIDRTTAPYRGWPAPVVTPVALPPALPPQFVGVDADPESYDYGLLNRASEFVFGHAIFAARIDTLGQVVEWVKARPEDPDGLKTDWEYLSYATSLMDRDSVMPLGSISVSDLARLAAAEIESILPALRFLPGHDITGRKVEMWVAVTPEIFR
jgi:hypothetical protein